MNDENVKNASKKNQIHVRFHHLFYRKYRNCERNQLKNKYHDDFCATYNYREFRDQQFCDEKKQKNDRKKQKRDKRKFFLKKIYIDN